MWTFYQRKIKKNGPRKWADEVIVQGSSRVSGDAESAKDEGSDSSERIEEVQVSNINLQKEDLLVDGVVVFGLNQHLLGEIESLTDEPQKFSGIVSHALNGKMLGMAETGSGKTLAFGLPILSSILNTPPVKDAGLTALVITPTRELAMQIAKHMKAVLGNSSRIRLAQCWRHIKARARLVTKAGDNNNSGRFCALMKQGVQHIAKLSQSLRFLVIDEADRMVERATLRIFSLSWMHSMPQRVAKGKRSSFLPRSPIREKVSKKFCKQ